MSIFQSLWLFIPSIYVYFIIKIFILVRIMELIHGTHKASKFAPQDFITKMPDNVVTNILDRLPVQHAVRTSILSRSWRFKWTMLSQLVFDKMFFKYLRKSKGKNNHGGVISRLLLHLSGAITKFVLCIDDELDAEDINHWILFLSRKGIKDLTIRNGDDTPLMLPTHLFSCLELKHVHLFNCCFNPPPTFHGFPNLLSLDLGMDFEENVQLGEFFTKCPLLEILTIDDRSQVGKVNVVELAKIKNLKVLSLQFCDLDISIFELVGSLPKLQELHLNFEDYDLIEVGDGKRFSATFPCLKVLKLSRMCLDDDTELSYAFELIRSFTNLQTLEITVANDWYVGPPPHINYDATGLLQLRSVKFECLKGSENELCLIKFLLACSPFLQKIVIHSHPYIGPDERMMFAKKLLMLHRASPAAEIDIFQF
ncbi:putative F-box domain, FBD domain, leucine-rich repeat domain superfamily [Helianthus annuus]|nr:putative F-box domain, FBD domain, leucine-rich repeat domain superfamily [Helianthus annuus]KAJ0642576.1 putative F-box domain, FBD domain, leucine-rich repeat domain superfamily [Helianthus annuus]KAJ0646453.1 putative F-box domain, FBD domain, leucine-rich repeat domain superfamily [Helianthus annuus]